MAAVCPAEDAKTKLLPVLAAILENDVVDFVPYCLQILAMIMDGAPKVLSIWHLLTKIGWNGISEKEVMSEV